MVHTKKYNSKIGRIILDRPKKAHAYTEEMLESLSNSIRQLESLPVIIIESSGDAAFCAGADLSELRARDAFAAHSLKSQRVFQQLACSNSISIAAVQGAAIAGGFELALACDFRVFGPNAYCKLPEVSLGLVPSAGGCTRLRELLGMARSKELVLTGRSLDAGTALQWGIANRAHANPRAEAYRWAEELIENDPVTLRLAKQLISSPSLARERVSEAVLYERQHQQM